MESTHNQLSKKTYYLMIETTNICNGRCIFCPNPTMKRKKETMSKNVFDTILRKVREEELNICYFTLHLNGEPLLDPHIFTRVKTIKDIFPASCVRFTSNFSLATESKIKELFDSGLDELVISLHSLDSLEYKKLMALDFDTTIKNIDRLFEYKSQTQSLLDIKISAVGSQTNTNVISVIQSKYSQSATMNVMNLGTWISSSSTLQENLQLSLKAEHRELDQENRQFFPCHVIQNTIPILSNGNFALCCFDAEGIINRNILKDSILETFNGEPYRIFREFHKAHGASNALCSHCNISIKKSKDSINILPPL